ncbi:hypothetical protein [Nocardioides sp. B-3]|nr:hypothetical protein [Nocardioides sp. B-3]
MKPKDDPWPDNAVIEIVVDADADTAAAQVEAGLSAAASAADDTF